MCMVRYLWLNPSLKNPGVPGAPGPQTVHEWLFQSTGQKCEAQHGILDTGCVAGPPSRGDPVAVQFPSRTDCSVTDAIVTELIEPPVALPCKVSFLHARHLRTHCIANTPQRVCRAPRPYRASILFARQNNLDT